MRVFQATVGNRAFPPDTGGYQRTNGLMTSFPSHGDTVRRYCCTGPAATYYADGELIDRERHITHSLVEQRQYSVLHDIPKLVTVLGYPAFPWAGVFKTWAGRNLLRSAAGHHVTLADDPYLARFLAENTDVPTVYSSHNVEYQRYASTATGPLTDFFADQLRRVEQQAVRKVDLVVCTTDADRKEFEPDAARTAVIPNGVAGEKVSNTVPAADRSRYGIRSDAIIGLFLGSDYGPNVEAAEWLAETWMELDGKYHLLIVGQAGDSVDSSATNVHTPGYVDDLQGTLQMADVALNPIFSGGGSNVKLIEYFAAGLPVVSSAFGARGFDVTDGEHLLVAERDEFFDAIRRCGDDGLFRERLGTNGQELAADRYTWESLSEQLREAIRELLTPATRESVSVSTHG